MSTFFPLKEVRINPNIQQEPCLITVVVITYNYGHFLGDCLHSLSEQTIQGNIRVLIIDSASDKYNLETKDAIRIARERGLEVSYLRRPNRHLLGCNRNYGIENCHSPFVLFLDADDQLNPFYLELCLFKMLRRNLDIVGTGHLRFTSDLVYSRAEGMHKKPSLNLIEIDNVFGSQALLRSDIFQICGGYTDAGLGPNLIFEDWRFYHKVLKVGGVGQNLPVDLVRYRVHSSSQSNQSGIPLRDTQSAAIKYLNEDWIKSDSWRDIPIVKSRQNSRKVYLNLLMKSSIDKRMLFRIRYNKLQLNSESNVAILYSGRAGSKNWYVVHKSSNFVFLCRALGIIDFLLYFALRLKSQIHLLMLH